MDAARPRPVARVAGIEDVYGLRFPDRTSKENNVSVVRRKDVDCPIAIKVICDRGIDHAVCAGHDNVLLPLLGVGAHFNAQQSNSDEQDSFSWTTGHNSLCGRSNLCFG